MSSVLPPFRLAFRHSYLLSRVAATLAVICAVGCGGGGTTAPSQPISGQTTTVTVLATSTGNDQLSSFNISIGSFSLVSESGKAVPVFATPNDAEFMHLNGRTEPLTTASIPQDTYTAATATVSTAGFGCITIDSSGGLVNGSFGYANTPVSVTVKLPAPISISGTAMGLSLDLLVSKSASWTTCDQGGPNVRNPYSITPTFELTPVIFSADAANGKLTGLEGVITSVDPSGNRFTVNAPDGPIWQVNSAIATIYQGVSDFTGLSAGMPVDMDLSIQVDGSMLATRVTVSDTDTANLSLSSGPIEETTVAWPALFADEVEELGLLSHVISVAPFSIGNAKFQISSQLTNLDNLPFPAAFDAANVAAGQNLSITTHATRVSAAPLYAPAATLTLLPQTINGTVSAISSEGGFTTYTVTLAPYDLFPALAVQGGQTALLTNPNTVVVYADSNTQMLNANAVAVGSVVRFYGLVFNDNGTLRMDCAQINDGVPE